MAHPRMTPRIVSSALWRWLNSAVVMSPLCSRALESRKIGWYDDHAFRPGVGHKARTLIGHKRLFVIERAGIDQKPFDRFRPAQLDDLVQEPRADAPSGELRHQTEIGNMPDAAFA